MHKLIGKNHAVAGALLQSEAAAQGCH